MDVDCSEVGTAQCKDVLIRDEVSAKPDATKFLMLIPES